MTLIFQTSRGDFDVHRRRVVKSKVHIYYLDLCITEFSAFEWTLIVDAMSKSIFIHMKAKVQRS